MFQNYEEEFCKILNSLQNKIALASSQTNEVRESAIIKGSKEVQEAEKCVFSIKLRQMEIELSMMSIESRGLYSSKVRSYRGDFEEAKRNFKNEESKESDQKNRKILMGARLDHVKVM